jgi:hypothetical protein
MAQNEVDENDLVFWKEKAQSELARRALAEARMGIAQARMELSIRKITAGLRHAASTEFQDYPEGTIELGAALDAIDMLERDLTAILTLPASTQGPPTATRRQSCA